MTQSTHKLQEQQQEGFTLVELSIVLVIIGLIVGGILVGQDMIKAATVRAQMTQLDSFNAASNTFRDKYRYYPGDIASAVATQYGLIAAAARTGANTLGDGDGLIEGGTTTAVADLANESLLYWSDLNQVGMLAGGYYDSARTTLNVGATALTGGTITNFLPEAKLGRGTIIHVFPAVGNNYFMLGGNTGATATAGAVTWADGLTPTEADNLDEKMDDGFPLTGIIRSFNTTTDAIAAGQAPTGGAATPGAGDCYDSDPKADYATSISTAGNEAIANTPGCNLRIRTTF